MLANFVRITVHADRIDMWPPCPKVIAAAEPFKVGVFWESGSEIWQSVSVEGFVREDETPVATQDSTKLFDRDQGNVVQDINFKYLESEDSYCKYSLVLTRAGGSGTFTLDPTMVLKKLG